MCVMIIIAPRPRSPRTFFCSVVLQHGVDVNGMEVAPLRNLSSFECDLGWLGWLIRFGQLGRLLSGGLVGWFGSMRSQASFPSRKRGIPG